MKETQVIHHWQEVNLAAQELGLSVTISDNRFHLHRKDKPFHRSSESIGALSAYLNGVLQAKEFFKK